MSGFFKVFSKYHMYVFQLSKIKLRSLHRFIFSHGFLDLNEFIHDSRLRTRPYINLSLDLTASLKKYYEKQKLVEKDNLKYSTHLHEEALVFYFFLQKKM